MKIASHENIKILLKYIDQKWWNKLIVEEKMKLNELNQKTTAAPTPERPASKTKSSITLAPTKASTKGPASTPTKSQIAKKPGSIVQPAKATNKQNQAPTNPKPSSAEAKKSVTDVVDKLQTLVYNRKNQETFDKDILSIQINLYLGRVYSKLKEIDKAKAYYENVIKKEPNVILFTINLSKILSKNNIE
jgi:hypothetical protein